MMASFSELPSEVIYTIADCGLRRSDLSAFARTNKQLHGLLDLEIYKDLSDRTRKQAAFQVAYSGHAKPLRNFLDLGFDPNEYWVVEIDYAITSVHSDILSHFHGQVRNSSDLAGTLVHEVSRDFSTARIDLENRTPANKLMKRYRKNITWTLLHVAAHRGHNEVVQLLLDRGANTFLSSIRACGCGAPKRLQINRPNWGTESPPWTALHLSICQGHDSTAKLLIGKGPLKLDEPQEPRREWYGYSAPPWGVTALHSAAQHGRLDLIKFLYLQGYSDIQEADSAGFTALEYAYTYGQWECFHWLQSIILDTPTSYAKRSSQRLAMLHDVCLRQRFADARLILQYIPHVDPAWTLTNCSGPSLLHACLSRPWDERRIPSTYYSRERVEKLRKQLAEEGFAVFTSLVELGANIEERDPVWNITPLRAAIEWSNIPVVEYLISKGANIDVLDVIRCTPLSEAHRTLNMVTECNILYALFRRRAWCDAHTGNGTTRLDELSEAIASNSLDWVSALKMATSEDRDILNKIAAEYDDRPQNPFEESLAKQDLVAAQALRSDQNSGPDRKTLHRWIKYAVFYSNIYAKGILDYVLSLDTGNSLVEDETIILELAKRGPRTRLAINVLLERNVPCTGHTIRDANALYWAIHYQWPVWLARILVERGASPNIIRHTALSKTCALRESLKIRCREKRRAYTRFLLESKADVNLDLGDSSHQSGRKMSSSRDMPDHRRTPMEFVLGTRYGADEEIMDMMLQPPTLASATKRQVQAYLVAACSPTNLKYFSFKALQILLGLVSGTLEDHFFGKLMSLLLMSLERVYNRRRGPSIRKMNEFIDALRLLAILGGSWQFQIAHSAADPGSQGGTNRDILESLCNPAHGSSPAMIAKAWCLRQRTRFNKPSDGDTCVEVSQDWIDTFGDTISLDRLGAIHSVQMSVVNLPFRSNPTEQETQI
jgi:ankyrin repeat protein